jgi:hypothetical protein
MAYRTQNGYVEETEFSESQIFSETPFTDPRLSELQEEPGRERYESEALGTNWEFTTPFLAGQTTEAGEMEAGSHEVATFAEMLGELKDSSFREAMEQLADEAMEAHAEQLTGEYGDRETRDASAEQLLNEHFQPLATEAEAMLDRFFERLESYEAESLTDMEIERVASEVMPSGVTVSPASEQFLGGLLRKARKLVSGAVRLAKRGVEGAISLAGKGLSALGKLALGPLLKPLKMLGSFLLKHVVRYALGQLPPTLRPLAQKLSDRLFKALGETHEGESEDHEQTETEMLAAGPDVARLEAEFDVQAAQLLLTSDEAEMEHLVSSYGEGESYTSPLPALDDARSGLVKELSRLQPGESAQPVMEQFVPAFLWPAAKTAITIMGRPKLVAFLGNLLSGLVKPLIGADAAGMLAPAIADAGLRIFGLETNSAEPRAAAAEALAATVEETLQTVSELPPHVLENEFLLGDAVREAFETAASSYFPNSVIKPELRESAERNGMWQRMPSRTHRKRYAKYSDTLPVEISPRAASTIGTFGNSTLNDHIRDNFGGYDRPLKANVTLYQALPGARGSTIARAEGFPASQLHPLTPQAAAVLLGPSAGIGWRDTPAPYLASPQRLHVNQRLYRIEPPRGRHYRVRPMHSELLISLPRGEIRLWLYISEPVCQRIAADLAKRNNIAAAYARIKPLVVRTVEALKFATVHHHLPPTIVAISDRPNLHNRTPAWLRHTGRHIGAKVGAWAQAHIAQYLTNNSEEFRRVCASHHDGVTLRITMSRIHGMDSLRLLSQGRLPLLHLHAAMLRGIPSFEVVLRPGFAIHRARG